MKISARTLKRSAPTLSNSSALDAPAGHPRGSARARGYDRAWDRASLAYRKQHPLCLGCEAVDDVTPTALVDHIVPFRGDHDLKMDPHNWQPSCTWHHSVVKQILEAKYEQGELREQDLRLDSKVAVSLTIDLYRR
jgi:5-methylcytosine-specific restriction endonuclease McrA